MTDPKAPSNGRQTGLTPILFGRYYLIDRISKGGMSDIYLGKMVGVAGFQKPVVIKKLLPQYSTKPRFMQRFLTEAKTLAQLNHANIVHILDMGAINEEYYIALEYIEGRNVAHLVSRAKRFGRLPSLDFCLYLVLEVAKGLAYAHRKKGANGESLGLVHQDVNSFNVMVSYDGAVKIIDFGIARIFLDQNTFQGLPVTGKLLYFSPEQLKKQQIDRRVDIYGIGVLCYELITGERLVGHQASVSETVKTILEMDVQQKIQEDERIPEELKPILARAMAFEPEDRYPWMEEMIHDIRGVVRKSSLELDPSVSSKYVKDLFRKEVVFDEARIRKLLSWKVEVPELSLSSPALPPLEQAPPAVSNGDSADLSLATDGPVQHSRKEASKFSGPPIRVPAGRMIFRQGNTGTDIYSILQGTVALFLKAGSEQRTLAVLKRGDFFGETALLGLNRRLYYARAVEDSILVRVGREAFLSLVPQEQSRKVVLDLVKKLRETTHLLRGALFKDPLTRFIYALMCLHERNVAQNASHIALKEVADLFGLDNRRLFQQYIEKLEALQVLESTENSIRVTNIRKLENIFQVLSGGGKLTLKL